MTENDLALRRAFANRALKKRGRGQFIDEIAATQNVLGVIPIAFGLVTILQGCCASSRLRQAVTDHEMSSARK
jgi:hypothetical protein